MGRPEYVEKKRPNAPKREVSFRPCIIERRPSFVGKVWALRGGRCGGAAI